MSDTPDTYQAQLDVMDMRIKGLVQNIQQLHRRLHELEKDAPFNIPVQVVYERTPAPE